MKQFQGKRILVTGACGTVGSELVKQLLLGDDYDVKELIGIDNNESALFFIDQQYLNDTRANFFVTDIKDKDELINIAKKLVKLDFNLIGTKGTSNFLMKENIPIKQINKISEGSPHVVDLLDARKISLVINTTEGKSATGDSYIMRRNTLLSNTPYYTTIKGASAAVNSIEAIKKSNLQVRCLQSMH